jgi:alkylation response protein AidB-like acyl-CoA dehydrogenase
MIRLGSLRFADPAAVPGESQLRAEVRAFIAGERFEPRSDSWLTGYDPGFSKRLAAAGFVGMTIPERYGGHGRSFLERYIVIEELLAAGAPVAAHWFADRQVAPLLLRNGTEDQRETLLPRIARGECFYSIGMSEPGAGSDLAAVRTRADEADGRFLVHGQKTWTSHAHRNHYMLTLCRTDPPEPGRHDGLSQLLVDLRAPGVDVRPIKLLNGEEHFSEVFLEGVEVPTEMLIGTRGKGWTQVISELAFERSGPERVLTTFPLLVELVRELGPDADERATIEIGRLVARTETLLRLSRCVATGLDTGAAPADEAALVKDVGTRHEQDVVETARLVLPLEPRLDGPRAVDIAAADAMLAAPGFTLRGGTNEILRGIVSRAVLAEQ